ncbi:hypothetical protein SK128_020550 [Halocaridina rubra]|uniref:Protein asteroid n=1 Tax=Halocaridina rubra TaxID=373956 RepID=A0AAN8X3T4_HALRR
MGIRGLTSYMTNHQFLENYRLRNCNVIIDGNNLAHNLHNECTGINVAFGGDFDKYANFVKKYFESLRLCGVHALVVMDGAHPIHNKKLKTAEERAVAQIINGLAVTPENQFANKIFPPMCLQVFVTTLQRMGVLVLQSDYEADDDIASLARHLNCIVISQDSDFYLANVRYVPLSSISYKNISPKSYIQCQIFKAEEFCKRTGVNPLHLPLLGTLMINSYVTDEELAEFHKKIAWQLERRRIRPPFGRSAIIRCAIKWMAQHKDKTVDGILYEVCGPSKRFRKKLVMATSGLTLIESKLLDCIPYVVLPESTEKSLIHEELGEQVKYIFDVRNSLELQTSSCLRSDLVLKSCGKPPSWFVKAYRENRIPREVANILTHRYFFSPAQVECLESESSYLVVEPIIRSIYNYLKKECVAEGDVSVLNDKCITVKDIDCYINKDTCLSDKFENQVCDTSERSDVGVEDGIDNFCVERDDELDIIIEEESEGNWLDPLETNIVEDNGEYDDGVDNDCSTTVKGCNEGAPVLAVNKGREALNSSKRDMPVLCQEDGNAYKTAENSHDSCFSSVDVKDVESTLGKETASKPRNRRHEKKNILRWYIRHGRSLWCKNLKYWKADVDILLPSLNEVEFLSLAERRAAFYKMLKIESSFIDHDIPVDLELILNCIVYWFTNTKENLTDCHILTVLVCIFMYYIIDSKIGRIRTLQGFESAKSCQEKVLEFLNNPVYIKPNASELYLLMHMTNEECLVAGNNLFLYHHLNKAVRGKMYKRRVVHAFSEYQACVYFVQLVNHLLCSPFPFLCIENLWGGTFAYNVFTELSQTQDRLAKVVTFFGRGTCLLRLFHKIAGRLEEILHFRQSSAKKSLRKISKKKVLEHRRIIKQWEDSKVEKSLEKPQQQITKDKIERDLECLLDNRFAGMVIDSDSDHDQS